MRRHEPFHALTSLKGIFIIIIVLHNTFSIHPLFDALPGVSFLTLYGGVLGNSMFFMLSGFLLTCSYQDKIQIGQICIKDFLLRRLRKLYPLYLVTNGVSLLIDIARYGASAVVLNKLVFTLLLQMGGGLGQGNPYNAPTWFLSVLFLCYILFFFICWSAKHPTQYWCMTLAMVALGYCLTNAELQIPFLCSSNGIGYMNFFLGCALAQLYSQIPEKIHKWAKVLALSVLCVSIWLLMRYGVMIISGGFGCTAAFVLSPLILYLAWTDGVCQRILTWKPLVSLGKCSNQIFFWHLPVYYLFSDLRSWCLPDTVMLELHYLVYLMILGFWCIFFRRITKGTALSGT